MTEPELPEPLSDNPNATDSAVAAEPSEPQPEPWTPERVTEWNAYYDLYVALGVLLLVFVVSANKITHSSIWTWLQAGRIMAERGKPLVTDLFSYTETGRRWVNIPWLFEWSHALVFDGVFAAAPSDPADPINSTASREQFAAGALGALSALARLATVLFLLGIRRPGPGLWWSAICTMLALGAVPGPGGLGLGGIAGTAVVAPGTWGVLLLALALYLWHRTLDLGRRGALFGLVPLFLAWANLDDSFLIGLLILAAGVIGRIRPREPVAANPLPFSRALAILGACAAVCLVNPSFHRTFAAALTLLAPPLQRSVLFFGRGAGSQAQGINAWVIPVLYLVVVGLGLGSFVLNRRRFVLGRFLMYAAMALLWGANLFFRAEFAVIFAVTVALNGQEWYHDRFGTHGRLGRGWTLWSVGGRAVTIVLVFALVAMALTGWGKSPGDPIFGFGYNPDVFAFEVAEYLKSAKIDGRALNTTREQGDALAWRAFPHRQTFIDGRDHVFPAALVKRLQQTRLALSKDDVTGWKPLLDEFDVSAVMIDEPSSPNTYLRLLQSPNWVPFYDDGSVVLFGRADKPSPDLTYFRSHRLRAESLAYRGSRTIPPFDRPPTPMSGIDRIFRNRSLLESQPHTRAAAHWLQGYGTEDRSETGDLPDPAHCFLAIQEARIALARRPDDPMSYRLLSEAYRILMMEESALLNSVKLVPADAEAIVRTEPRTNLLMNRFRQRITALNNAIQTTPYPRSTAEREALISLNYQLFQLYMSVHYFDRIAVLILPGDDRVLFQLYMSVHYFDLARERLLAMLEQREAIHPDALINFDQQLIELNGRVKQIQDQLNDLTIEQQFGPLQRAGAPGLAIVKLEEAERTGISPALVRPQLVDLYCDTGQPEKALELLNTGNVEDPSLGSEPGVAAHRQAKVNFLLGNYEYSAQLWETRAIPQLAQERTSRALMAAQTLLRGQVKSATSLFLDLPGKIALQASWDLDLALCRLESGKPTEAASPLIEALTLAPDLALCPVAAYYLEKLGKPVPPPGAATPLTTKVEKPAAKKENPDDEKSPAP